MANGSSIALLLEHRGASVLLAGDAFADVLEAQLQALARQRGVPAIITDAVKLSHHGSRGNTTQGLMKALQARHFIVSTDNRYFGHPDPEAIARVVTGAEPPVLWFNHATEQNLKWGEAGLRHRYGYDARYPEDAGEGVRVELGVG